MYYLLISLEPSQYIQYITVQASDILFCLGVGNLAGKSDILQCGHLMYLLLSISNTSLSKHLIYQLPWSLGVHPIYHCISI